MIKIASSLYLMQQEQEDHDFLHFFLRILSITTTTESSVNESEVLLLLLFYVLCYILSTLDCIDSRDIVTWSHSNRFLLHACLYIVIPHLSAPTQQTWYSAVKESYFLMLKSCNVILQGRQLYTINTVHYPTNFFPIIDDTPLY